MNPAHSLTQFLQINTTKIPRPTTWYTKLCLASKLSIKIQKAILTLQKLKVFHNRMLRKIFGSKRTKGTEGWRKLYNEDFTNIRL
jgi:hypothetical protein